MTGPETINRRSLVIGATTGIIAGGVWGATMQALATPSHPTVSVIGTKDMQVVLLDTTQSRALVLLGVPVSDLQIQIPALMTLFRQRIDLLIGTTDAIAALGPDFNQRWRVEHELAIPAHAAVGPNTSKRTWITENMTASLGGGVFVDMLGSTRIAWNAIGVEKHLWVATIRSASTAVSMAPDQTSAEVLAPGGQSLLVVPKGIPDRLIPLVSPASIATNARDDLEMSGIEGRQIHLVRTYPEDIARFEFRVGGISLPTWAEASK